MSNNPPVRQPTPHPFANPLIVGLLVFGSVAVVGLVVALGMVAMRPTVNVADRGSAIDNSPSANVEVRYTSGVARINQRGSSSPLQTRAEQVRMLHFQCKNEAFHTLGSMSSARQALDRWTGRFRGKAAVVYGRRAASQRRYHERRRDTVQPRRAP